MGPRGVAVEILIGDTDPRVAGVEPSEKMVAFSWETLPLFLMNECIPRCWETALSVESCGRSRPELLVEPWRGVSAVFIIWKFCPISRSMAFSGAKLGSRF